VRKLVALATAALCLGLCHDALATEGGGGAYPNGAEGFMTGAVPPPGNYIIDYVLYYSADKLANDDGDDMMPKFDLTVFGNVLRFIHVTPKKVLGGFWAQHIFVPVLNVDVDATMGEDDKLGLGDIIIDPCVIAWHGQNWHAAAGIDIYVPVGAYDEDDLANVGRNYWTIEPVAAVTVMPTKSTELSAKFMYDINMENSDTDYTSGQEFHVDYAASMRVKNWQLGVGGYYYQQVTEDDLDGPGMEMEKGRVFGIGPQVGLGVGKMQMILKYQTELEARNRPEGDKVWFKLVCPL